MRERQLQGCLFLCAITLEIVYLWAASFYTMIERVKGERPGRNKDR